MIKTLTIEVALKLIKELDEKIREQLKTIDDNKLCTKEQFEYIGLLDDQLNTLKLAKDRCNSKKQYIFWGKSNNYWIYKLSGLKRREASLLKLKKHTLADIINKEIKFVKRKIEEFNQNQQIRLQLNEKLGLKI